MINKSYLFLLIFLAINNLIYNDSGDVSSDLSINATHYIIGILNIIFVIVLIFLNPKFRFTPLGKSIFYILPFLVISSIISFSFQGLYNVFIFFQIILLGSYIANNSPNYQDKIRIIIFYCITVYLMKMITIYLRDGTFSFFVPIDKTVVFLLFVSTQINNIKGKFYFLLAILGRSLSGFGSFVISFMFVRYRKLFWISSILIFFFFTTLISILENNVGQAFIYDKNIEHLLTGSGRFELYVKGFGEYFNSSLHNLIFGYGYMTERSVLSNLDLTWSSDPHNAILRSLLGSGLIGLVSLFYIYFKTYKYVVYNNKLKVLVISIIIFSQFNTVYGLKPNETHLLLLILASSNRSD